MSRLGAVRRSATTRRTSGDWVSTASSAVLLLAAEYGLWPFAAIAYTPWICLLRRSALPHALTRITFLTFLYGCGEAWWIPDAIGGLGGSWSGGLAWMLFAIAWAKGPYLFGFGLSIWATNRSPLWLRILMPSAVLFAIEATISAWRLGVPWALLGHSQADCLGVAQLATVGGVPLISALLAAIALAAAELSSDHRKRVAPALAGLVAGWMVLAAAALPLARAIRNDPFVSGPTVRFIAVQPNLPRSERWRPELQELALDRLLRLTQHSLPPLSDATTTVVLWPENALTTPIDDSPALRSRLVSHVSDWNLQLIAGLVRSAPSSRSLYRSSVLWIAPGHGVVAEMDKRRAIPILESASPLSAALPQALSRAGFALSWTGIDPLTPRVLEGIEAGPFEADFAVAVLLCYEALFPDISDARRGEESFALINLADDSWVEAEIVTRTLTRIARFRAIEQRLPLIRVAHGGLSSVSDSYGRVIDSLPLDRYGSMTVELQAEKPPRLTERLAIAALPFASALSTYCLWRTSEGRLRRHRSGSLPRGGADP